MLRVRFSVFCCVLYRANSRGTQSTGTPGGDSIYKKVGMLVENVEIDP